MEKAIRFLFFALITAVFLCCSGVQAQDDKPLKNKSEQIEVFNGKRVYFHTVIKKQTLYAISKAYNVSVDTILAINLEAKEGIKTDQVLKIPILGDKKEAIFHKAAANETLYAIGKQYNLEVSDLINVNPELSNGLKVGQIIRIPDKKPKIDDTVKNNNKVPDKKNNTCTPFNKKEPYNVALMIPLYLEDINKLDLAEIKVVEKFKKNKSFTFIAFYEGVLLALDSLQQLGMSVNLFVYDVEKDTNKIASLLEKPEIKTMDLIIGPFFNETLKKVVTFVQPYDINVISPLSFDNSLLKSNPNVFQAMPSQYIQLECTAKYIMNNYPNSDIIIVHSGVAKDLSSAQILEKIIDSLTNNITAIKKYKEVAYNKEGLAGIKQYLAEDKENIVVTFSSEEMFVMNYVRNLSALTDKYNIILFGSPHWRSFENVETDYLTKLNLHLTSSSFIDYEDEKTINLVSKYRNQYYSEPDRYVFQGFDEAFYFLSILKTYGKDFENCIYNDTIVKYIGISNHFNFTKPVNNNGSENNFVMIYKYQDLKLIPLITKE